MTELYTINYNTNNFTVSQDLEPPPSNRGVLNTKIENSDFKLDYLTFTIPYWQVEETITPDGQYLAVEKSSFDYLHGVLGDWVPRSGGLLGYPQSATLECGGIVAWNDNYLHDEWALNQKIYISLSSKALARLGIEPVALVKLFKGLNANFGRIDIAKDDYDGLLDLDVIEDKIRMGEMSSRFRQWSVVEGGDIGAMVGNGKTVYLGSRVSNVMFRFYDKAKEQGVSGHHVRCEAEFKHKGAERIAELIIQNSGLSEALAGVFYQYIDFKNPEMADTNKSRWPTAFWWSEFLKVKDKVSLGLSKPSVALRQAQEWAFHQLSAILATLDEVDPFWFGAMLKYGQRLLETNKRYKKRLSVFASEWHDSGSYVPA